MSQKRILGAERKDPVDMLFDTIHPPRWTGRHIRASPGRGKVARDGCAGFPIEQLWPSWRELPNIKHRQPTKGGPKHSSVLRRCCTHWTALYCILHDFPVFLTSHPGACQQKFHTVSSQTRIPSNAIPSDAIPTSQPTCTAQNCTALHLEEQPCRKVKMAHSQGEYGPLACPGPGYRFPRQAADARHPQRRLTGIGGVLPEL